MQQLDARTARTVLADGHHRQRHTIPARLIGAFRDMIAGQKAIERLAQRIQVTNEAARILTMTERGRTPRLTTKDGRPARPIETRQRTRGGFYIVQLAAGPNRHQRRSAKHQQALA